MEAVWASAFRVAVRDGVVNDACDGAIELPFSSVQDYSNVPRGTNALAADGTGGCLPTKDVWYRFTAAHTSAGFMAVNGDQGFLDTSIELFQGNCGSLTSLGCTNDAPRAIFNGLVPGTEYRIRWSRASIGFHTPMLFDQPVNDEVAGALPAAWGSTFAQAADQYDTFGATESMPVDCPPGASDDDTWFTFTATATSHSILALQRNNSFFEPSLFPYSSFNVAVYDTLTADPAVLATNVVECGFSPLALTGLTIGKQYLYRAYQAETGPAKRCGFSTSVSNANNDEAAGAHTLVYADDYTAYFNTTGATQSQPGADCQVDDTADDDIWFKFTGAAGAGRIAIGYATEDVTIELFSGTPGNLVSIACDGNILELPALTGGQIYYARVYSWGSAVPVEGRIGLFMTPSLTANNCVDENCLGPVLVNNPGIEQGEYCFAHIAGVDAMAGQGGLLAPGWPRLQSGSSDAFGSCSNHDGGREVPGNVGNYVNAPLLLSRSGKGMGGLLMADGQPFQYVEYLQAQLAEPLVPGEPYLVSFYAATDPAYMLCLSGLGAALSEGPLVWGHQDGPLTVQPAVVSLEPIRTTDWTNLCAIYVPTSAVDHITIGAFQREGEARRIGPSSGRSYYAIDDVVVARITNPSCITSIGDVPPLDEEANNGGDALRVYPNPANELLNIVADPSLLGQRAVIEVFDATGSRVYAEQVSYFSALQPLDLSREWKEGLYLVMVRVEGQAPKAARVMVKH
jgi:Secretion system C-terminal sorting domain